MHGTGATAHLAASYLGKPLEVVLDYQSGTTPPYRKDKGVELATEGVVTIGLALEAEALSVIRMR